MSNPELNIDSSIVDSSFLAISYGDFNGKSNLWYNNHITIYEDSKTDGATLNLDGSKSIKNPHTLLVTPRRI